MREKKKPLSLEELEIKDIKEIPPRAKLKATDVNIINFSLTPGMIAKHDFVTLKFDSYKPFDFCEFKVCNETAGCVSDRFLTKDLFFPDLPVGLVNFEIQCCLRSEHSVTNKKLCGATKTYYYRQKKALSANSKKLWRDYQGARKLIQEQASHIQGYFKTFLDEVKGIQLSEKGLKFRRMAQNHLNLGVDYVARILSSPAYEELHHSSSFAQSLFHSGGFDLAPRRVVSFNNKNGDEGEDTSEQVQEDSGESFIESLKKPWITSGNTIFFISAAEITVVSALFAANLYYDNAADKIGILSKQGDSSVSARQAKIAGLEGSLSVVKLFKGRKEYEIMRGKIEGKIKKINEEIAIRKPIIEKLDKLETSYKRRSYVAAMALTVVGIGSLVVAFLQTDMKLTSSKEQKAIDSLIKSLGRAEQKLAELKLKQFELLEKWVASMESA